MTIVLVCWLVAIVVGVVGAHLIEFLFPHVPGSDSRTIELEAAHIAVLESVLEESSEVERNVNN